MYLPDGRGGGYSHLQQWVAGGQHHDDTLAGGEAQPLLQPYLDDSEASGLLGPSAAKLLHV